MSLRTPAPATAIARGWPEVAVMAVGAGVLVLAALPVDAGRVSDAETGVFRVLNGTTVLPFVLVWPVMQLGNVVVVPASALLAAVRRRWRLAGELLIAGITTKIGRAHG